jgi:hypothetical protein
MYLSLNVSFNPHVNEEEIEQSLDNHVVSSPIPSLW